METQRSVVSVVTVLFLLISFHSSDGFKCWFCSSTGSTKNTCGANFNPTGIESLECGDVSCVRQKTVFAKDPGHGMDKVVFTRACGKTKEKDKNITNDVPGKYTTDICYCNSDKCNAAMLPNVSALAIGLEVLLELMF